MRQHPVVIKVGSSVLAGNDGRLDIEQLSAIADCISAIRSQGIQVVLVSSGAVASGFSALGLTERPKTTRERQAAAATGQVRLMQSWQEAFNPHGIQTAQILLTRKDFALRTTYKNALRTFEYLLSRNVVPVVNENDTVAVEELTFGDNDMLAALVAAFLHASRLFLLSTVDGVYTGNPAKDSSATLIPKITAVDQALLEFTETGTSTFGTGGMRSKLRAAAYAADLGIPVFIGSGLGLSAAAAESLLSLSRIGTTIAAAETGHSRKKQWIAFHADATGKIVIDDGAKIALLKNGRSLLPVGVSAVERPFSREEVIEVYDQNGRLLGRGIGNYSASELEKMMTAAAGVGPSKALIHRNEWVSLYLEEDNV